MGNAYRNLMFINPIKYYVMKKTIFPLMLLIVFAFFSCTKDNLVPPHGDHSLDLKKKNKNVFVVPPSGGDDTDALLQAFEDAKAAGPYANVKLVAGEYHAGLIEVHSFFGSFTGAGKDATIILPTPNLPVSNSNESNVLPAWFKFIAGDLIISHMTFKVPDGLPCQDPDDGWFATDLYTILDLADFTEHYRPETRYLKALVEHVNFIGGSDNGEGGYWQTTHNTLLGIWIGIDFWWGEAPEYTMMVGDVSISHCYFENFLDAFEYSHMMNSKGAIHHNVLVDTWWSVFMNYLVESEMHIYKNKFSGNLYGDIQIDDSDWGLWAGLVADQSTNYYIHENHFDVEPGSLSLTMLEMQPITGTSEDVPFPVYNISNNHFDLPDGATGINGLNTQNSYINNNKFKGNGLFGIYLDGTEEPEIYAENVSILNNKFNPASFTEANIYLGPYTRDCKVVGNTPEETIIDNGENNDVKVLSKIKGNKKSYYDMKEIYKEFYENHFRSRK